MFADPRSSAPISRQFRESYSSIFRVGALAIILAVQIALAIYHVEPSWRTDWLDVMQRTLPRQAYADLASSPVRIVALQENEDGEADQLIWPRDRIARVVDRIGKSGARAIGVDLPLDGVGIFEIADISAGNVDGADRTRFLADIITQHPAVLPAILYEPGALRPPATRRAPDPALIVYDMTEKQKRDIARVKEVLDRSKSTIGVLQAHPALARAAKAEGLVIDELGSERVTRALPMVQVVRPEGGTPRLFNAMPVEMLRIGSADVDADVYISESFIGSAHLNIGDAYSLPIDREGNLKLKLRERDLRMYIDGNDVFHGRFAPEFFKDKYVIISKSYGAFDGVVDTPLFETAMTAEPLAQVIEEVLSASFVTRPPWAIWVEILTIALIGLVMIRVLPVTNPQNSAPASLLLAGSMLPLTLALYAWAGLALDGLSVSVALFVIGTCVFITMLVDRDRQHKDAELALLEERAEKSRLDGELDVARRIQMGLLPQNDAHPDPLLEIACHIQPALMVGGDFYDYVVRPDGRVFFMIADVSGKGVPASLFMALSKSLWKSAALRVDNLPGIQALADREISRDNTDHMFVTGVSCMFDPQTSTLSYSGAGHDMPILARTDGFVGSLPEASGPPHGLGSKTPYPVGEITLHPGDIVCLFTDGVSEAELTRLPDGSAIPRDQTVFFGAEGVIAALGEACASGASARDALSGVLALLDQVTDSAAQTDDRTLIVVRALPRDAET